MRHSEQATPETGNNSNPSRTN